MNFECPLVAVVRKQHRPAGIVFHCSHLVYSRMVAMEGYKCRSMGSNVEEYYQGVGVKVLLGTTNLLS